MAVVIAASRRGPFGTPAKSADFRSAISSVSAEATTTRGPLTTGRNRVRAIGIGAGSAAHAALAQTSFIEQSHDVRD